MGFLSLVRVVPEVALPAGGLVAPGPPAGIPVGGAGQPSRHRSLVPGMRLSTLLFMIGMYRISLLPNPAMLLSAAVIRRRLAQISA